MAKAPNFSLPDQTGTQRSLSDFAGHWLVLYFYPQDDTPGCTTEACEFRDAYTVLREQEVQVVGVSKDPVESHAAFAAKYHLGFPLLADTSQEVMGAYGVDSRMTFLISPEGEIIKIYPQVTPEGHAAQILADLGVESPSEV